jgi:NADPH-dependent curcumin reductase CurA
VIGCAGSDDKVAFIKSLGFDAAFNYKTTPIEEGLSTHAPTGIDVYFDNVRGPILDTALLHMNEFGRIALCGGISEYTVDPDKQYGLKNLGMATSKQLTLQGFLVGRYYSKFKEAIGIMQQWIRDGRLRHRETIREGFGELPDAFLGLFRGDNTGKMLVKV